MLGRWSRKDTLYGGEGYSVLSQGDLAEQLRLAVGRLPRFEPTRTEAQNANPPPRHVADKDVVDIVQAHEQPAFVTPPPLKHISEGSFFVGDDRVVRQVEDGSPEPVTYCGVLLKADGTPGGRRFASLIELRDLARRVLQSQNEGWPEANREDARRDLNRAYDRFVAANGPVNKTTFTARRKTTARPGACPTW